MSRNEKLFGQCGQSSRTGCAAARCLRENTSHNRQRTTGIEIEPRTVHDARRNSTSLRNRLAPSGFRPNHGLPGSNPPRPRSPPANDDENLIYGYQWSLVRNQAAADRMRNAHRGPVSLSGEATASKDEPRSYRLAIFWAIWRRSFRSPSSVLPKRRRSLLR